MRYTKNMLAVAVAGAIAAPASVAMAQSSTVQIGGSLTFLYYVHDPKNNASRKSDILEGSEPQLVVRGSEKLGGGLTAWFQCASSFDLWGGNGDEGFCSRNSALGFRGSWGNVFAGNWDSPHKLNYNQARGAFSGTNPLYGGTASLLYGGSASGADNTENPERFYRRQARSFSYHSPSWNGFTVNGMYSSGGPERTAMGGSPLDPRMYSFAGAYRTGPLYVGLGYEIHQDWNPAGAGIGVAQPQNYGGGDDTNWSIVGVYTFNNAIRLSGVYSSTEYETTNASTMDVDGFAVYVDWRIQGPHRVRFQYGTVDDPSGNFGGSVGRYVTSAAAGGLGTGADVFGINYEYAFSKRTAGLIGYNKISNDAGARFSLGKANASLGGDQTSMGIAVKHRF